MARDVACFDLDGTIVEPGGSIRKSLDAAVALEGLTPFAPDEVLIGLPLRDILRTRTQDAKAIERMVEEFRRFHEEEAWQFATYHAGFPDVIADVRDLGIQTAIVTTKGEREAHHMMESLGILHLWDTIVGDDDVRPLKPDPAPVIAACGRLGHHPRDAVMVGDTRFDIEAGRAAGAHTIGVTWGSGAQWNAGPDAADVLVDDATQLLAAIRSWRDGHKP